MVRLLRSSMTVDSQLTPLPRKIMFETRPIQEKDHADILKVTEALHEWFTSDARELAAEAFLKFDIFCVSHCRLI